jgi:hypothetical protein
MRVAQRVLGSIAFPALFGFYVGATATVMAVVHGTLDMTGAALCLIALAVAAQMFAMYRELHAMRVLVDGLVPKPGRTYGRRVTDRKDAA